MVPRPLLGLSDKPDHGGNGQANVRSGGHRRGLRALIWTEREGGHGRRGRRPGPHRPGPRSIFSRRPLPKGGVSPDDLAFIWTPPCEIYTDMQRVNRSKDTATAPVRWHRGHGGAQWKWPLGDLAQKHDTTTPEVGLSNLLGLSFCQTFSPKYMDLARSRNLGKSGKSEFTGWQLHWSTLSLFKLSVSCGH